MTYIIAEPCVNVKDKACVEVCPVDCIHEASDHQADQGSEILYIDPRECIDCGACVPACPVEAIFPEDEVPSKWHAYIGKNYGFFGLTPAAKK